MKHPRTITKTLSLCAIICVSAIPAFALDPISYQGRITDPGGNPVPNGVYTIDFVLWDSETLGSVVWSDFGNAINVQDGLFSFLLGDATPFPENLFHENEDLWLTVIVDLEAQEPRVRITAAGYANELTTGPGIAHTFNPSTTIGPLSSWGASNSNDPMILGREIVCPTDGYVVATVTGYLRHDHTSGSATWARLTLGTANVGQTIDSDNMAWHEMPSTAPSGTYWTSFAITKVEAVTAGSRTYYFRGAAAFANDIWIARPHLTLMFFPEAYGTVTNSEPPTNPQGPQGVEATDNK